MSRNDRWWRRPVLVIPVVVVAAGAFVLAMAAFQPWRLFIDVTVDEALPAPTSTVTSEDPKPVPTAEPVPSEPSTPTPEAERVVTAEGEFISHEHPTEGKARIITLADGSRVLRLVGLDTDNGPDLRVWLAAAPVIEGRDGWFVFDDDDYLDLGALKGNKGNQNYPIPDDVDISGLTSVSIWCKRFSVSFGAAELQTL